MNRVLLARLQFHPIRHHCCFQNHSLDESPSLWRDRYQNFSAFDPLTARLDLDAVREVPPWEH
jgi:hypothetical protein